MKIRALLVILLTLACAGAYAQDGGVKGKVVSRDGRVALSNVKVVVEPLGVTVMTDNHGNFNIDQLPKGEYQLKFEAPEFENLDLAVRVDKMVKNLNSVVMAPDVQYVIDDAVFAEFDSDTAATGSRCLRRFRRRRMSSTTLPRINSARCVSTCAVTIRSIRAST